MLDEDTEEDRITTVRILREFYLGPPTVIRRFNNFSCPLLVYCALNENEVINEDTVRASIEPVASDIRSWSCASHDSSQHSSYSSHSQIHLGRVNRSSIVGIWHVQPVSRASLSPNSTSSFTASPLSSSSSGGKGWEESQLGQLPPASLTKGFLAGLNWLLRAVLAQNEDDK